METKEDLSYRENTELKRLYIFGAASRAKTLTGYIRSLWPECIILGYLIDDDERNPDNVFGINIIDLRKEYSGASSLFLDLAVPVYIATKGIYHDKIAGRLEDLGFESIVPVTPTLDNIFRNRYIEMFFARTGRSFLKYKRAEGVPEIADESFGKYVEGDDISSQKESQLQDFRIYAAASVYDNKLLEDHSQKNYEIYIQAGAYLTDDRICEGILTDDTGDNISSKNRMYCELTVLYWIWKNSAEDYVGLCQYRRFFDIDETIADWMKKGGIDVVLPVPTCVFPNVETNFRERHDSEVWGTMLYELKSKHRDMYEFSKGLFAGNIYYPCNMFLMRRDVMEDMCTWLFPILESVTETCGEKEDPYMNRYPGFISERLITLYFEYYRDRYTIAYADRIFLR